MLVGRNDPCPCGSGKKYKKCCLPREQVISLDAVRTERLYTDLLDRLLEFSSDLPREESMADGVLRYFGGPPPEKPTDMEFMEPLDWAHFGYRSPATGTTLAERFAREGRSLSEAEKATLLTWATESLPGIFTVTNVTGGAVNLRRLGDQKHCKLNEEWEGLQVGDLVSCWLLPGPWGLRSGYHQGLLQAEATPLEHLLREELMRKRRQRPGATWDELYREYWPHLIDLAGIAGAYGAACTKVRVQARPQIQGAPQENEAALAVAQRLTEILEEQGRHPEEVAGGLRLWWDAVHVLKPRMTRVEPWVGAILYLLSVDIYGSDETQAEVAALAGTSVSSLGSRSRQIREALQIETGDPRYVDLLDPMVRSMLRIDTLAQLGLPEKEILAEMLGLSNVVLPDPEFDHSKLDDWEFEDSESDDREPDDSLFDWEPEDGKPDDPNQARAEELINRAWEAQGKRRLRFAQQAIDLWDGAADAYVILGHAARERGQMVEAARLYQAGVEAGERALGKRFFKEEKGHFWGWLESRPYMRARFSLADALWDLGEHETAISHYDELLRLNKNDNQGVRYVLAMCLVELGDDHRLEQLLKAHADDASATMLFTGALLAFRQTGAGREANERLREACQYNPHVPAYLLGKHRVPAQAPEYIGLGDESEAVAYAVEFRLGWTRTPGALDWLASRT